MRKDREFGSEEYCEVGHHVYKSRWLGTENDSSERGTGMIKSAEKKGMKRISLSPLRWKDIIDRLDIARNVGLVPMMDHIVSLYKWEPLVNLCGLYFFEDSLTFVIQLASLLMTILRYSVRFCTVKHTLTSHRHESIRSSRKIRIAELMSVASLST